LAVRTGLRDILHDFQGDEGKKEAASFRKSLQRNEKH